MAVVMNSHPEWLKPASSSYPAVSSLKPQTDLATAQTKALAKHVPSGESRKKSIDLLVQFPKAALLLGLWPLSFFLNCFIPNSVSSVISLFLHPVLRTCPSQSPLLNHICKDLFTMHSNIFTRPRYVRPGALIWSPTLTLPTSFSFITISITAPLISPLSLLPHLRSCFSRNPTCTQQS